MPIVCGGRLMREESHPFSSGPEYVFGPRVEAPVPTFVVPVVVVSSAEDREFPGREMSQVVFFRPPAER